MLMWNHHLSSVITKRWSEKLILGNLVTKFPLISMRKGIWLFNLQENLMGILRTANTLLHQLLKFFLAFLLYLQHELVYRKDLHHFPYLHIAMLSLCVVFFFSCTCFVLFSWFAEQLSALKMCILYWNMFFHHLIASVTPCTVLTPGLWLAFK